MKKIIILLIFSFSILVQAQITNGLIGHWPLDNNANDVVGTNNGTTYGVQPTADRDGNANSAYNFEDNQYIQLGNAPEFDFGSQPFTISAWVNRTQAPSSYDNIVIGKWNTGGTRGTNEWLLTLSSNTSNNHPNFTVEMGLKSYSATSFVELNLNQWYHVTAVRRATVLEIYVDGVITGIKGIPNLPINSTGRNLEIARIRNNIYLDGGKIDDIKIFDRDLSQNEVALLYNESTPIELASGLYSIAGNVGIGINNTSGYKLAVKGKILAEELKVQVYPWSDFVFEEDYKLPTIAEVEKHINDKGHLQHIPSAKEVAKNGIYVGQMDAKLLQKIEELMLYTIAQDKEITQQEKLLNKLELQLKNSKK